MSISTPTTAHAPCAVVANVFLPEPPPPTSPSPIVAPDVYDLVGRRRGLSVGDGILACRLGDGWPPPVPPSLHPDHPHGYRGGEGHQAPRHPAVPREFVVRILLFLFVCLIVSFYILRCFGCGGDGGGRYSPAVYIFKSTAALGLEDRSRF